VRRGNTGEPTGAGETGELDVPTAIAVTSADLALPPHDERTVPAVVLQDLDRQPLDQSLAAVQALIDQLGHADADADDLAGELQAAAKELGIEITFRASETVEL
jgi:hypothetical protein